MLCALFSLILLTGMVATTPVPAESDNSDASGYHKYHEKYPAPPKYYAPPPKYYAPPPPQAADYSNYGSYVNYEGHNDYGKYEGYEHNDNDQKYDATQVEASYPSTTAPSHNSNYGSYGSYEPEHPHGYENNAKEEDPST